MAKRNHTHNTSSNKASLIKGGAAYFNLLKKLIDDAEQLIHFQFYIFDPDQTGHQIANALMTAAKRGVKVYLLVDAYGSQKLSGSFVKELQNSGIHFQWFQPLFTSRKFYLGRRLHHKVVVIDSYHSLVSGLNISDRYNDMPEAEAWLDWALHCEGDVSLQLEDVCRKRMKLRTPKNKAEHEVVSSDCEIGVRINDWVGRRQEITQTYLKMLKEAQSTVVIMSPYFMPGYQFRRNLKAVAKRGVKVQIILTANSDVPAAKYAERFMYDWLFRNNIEVWEYQKNVLHGKLAIADKKSATLGSYNMNNLSAYASIELNLEVIDQTLVQKIEKELHLIMEQDCRRITQDLYEKQVTIFKRLLQVSAYNFMRFMLFIFTLRIRYRE